MAKFTQEDILEMLNKLYNGCLKGIPNVSDSIEKMAEDYLSKHDDIPSAVKEMHRYQIAKCGTSGAVTGLGGLITMPITVPANIGSVLFVQMRMIACTAYMAGYDIYSEQVQTLVYACLAGVSVGKIFKQFGVKFSERVATNMIKKIPGKVFTAINKKLEMRFITKFGEKGFINLGKMVPAVGAVVGGTYDSVETVILARRAYKQFVKGEFFTDNKEDSTEDDYIDADFEELE